MTNSVYLASSQLNLSIQWTHYSTVNVYVDCPHSFLWTSYVDTFIYICIARWRPIYQEGGSHWSVEPLLFCFWFKPGHGFQTSDVMFIFMYRELSWKVIVHIVDIGGIVNQHCLSFPFIIFIVFFLLTIAGLSRKKNWWDEYKILLC